MDISITLDVKSALRASARRQRTICGRCRALLRGSLSRVSAYTNIAWVIKGLVLLSLFYTVSAAPSHHLRHRGHHRLATTSSSPYATEEELLASSSISTQKHGHFDPYYPCTFGSSSSSSHTNQEGTMLRTDEGERKHRRKSRTHSKRNKRDVKDVVGSRDVEEQTREHVTESLHHVKRITHWVKDMKTRYADERFPENDERNYEGFNLPNLPKASQENSIFQYNVGDLIEATYHDLVAILYYLREAEIHEDLHEHASFLEDLVHLRAEIMSLLCRFKILDSIHDQFEISPEVTPAVVPPEVSNMDTKSVMRVRDYVVLHYLDKYLHQLQTDLYTWLE